MTLRLADLRVEYDDATIGPLSLAVADGVTAVLGPSGAGKSTLLSAVAGFEEPTTGTIELAGRRLDGRPPEDRNVGLVFQDGALFPHLSVRENLAFGAGPDRDVDATAERLGVANLLDRAPGTLSGGERKRVALARTLVADPDALLLDEPLASLDAPIRRRLRLELREVLAALDVPVLYVTHDREEAAAVGDRLALLFDGAIVQSGPVESVFDAPETPEIARFVGYATTIDGTVRGRRDGHTLVDVGPTTLPVAEDCPAEAVTIAVRPPDLVLEPDDPATAIDCRVVTVVDHPDATVLECAWHGTEPIRARVDRDAAATLESGDQVTIGVDPDRSRLFARAGPDPSVAPDGS